MPPYIGGHPKKMGEKVGREGIGRGVDLVALGDCFCVDIDDGRYGSVRDACEGVR